MQSRRFSTLPVVGILTVVYFIAGKLGLKLAFLYASASPVWPPAGIALAAMLVLGYRTWPAIFIGAFLVNVTTAGDVTTSLCIATGNTLEAVCGVWLITRFAGGTGVFGFCSRLLQNEVGSDLRCLLCLARRGSGCGDAASHQLFAILHGRRQGCRRSQGWHG